MPIMHDSEDSFVSALMAELSSRGLPHHKMHGNIYQSGFPDLFIAFPGFFAVCECKILHQQKPNLLQLWQACRPLQRKNLCQYAAVGAPAFVAAATKLGPVLVPHPHFPKLLHWPSPISLEHWVCEDISSLLNEMRI